MPDEVIVSLRVGNRVPPLVLLDVRVPRVPGVVQACAGGYIEWAVGTNKARYKQALTCIPADNSTTTMNSKR